LKVVIVLVVLALLALVAYRAYKKTKRTAETRKSAVELMNKHTHDVSAYRASKRSQLEQPYTGKTYQSKAAKPAPRKTERDEEDVVIGGDSVAFHTDPFSDHYQAPTLTSEPEPSRYTYEPPAPYESPSSNYSSYSSDSGSGSSSSSSSSDSSSSSSSSSD
jgi:Tfp pilus assembly protein PilE